MGKLTAAGHYLKMSRWKAMYAHTHLVILSIDHAFTGQIQLFKNGSGGDAVKCLLRKLEEFSLIPST